MSAVIRRLIVFTIFRPMNAFMAWSQVERRRLVEEGRDINNSAVCRSLGERWKQLDDKEKMSWKRTADKLKKEHTQVD